MYIPSVSNPAANPMNPMKRRMAPRIISGRDTAPGFGYRRAYTINSMKILLVDILINSLINLGERGAAYLASNTMSLLVLFLYMILYPHSRHRIASRGRISFSLENKYFLRNKNKT